MKVGHDPPFCSSPSARMRPCLRARDRSPTRVSTLELFFDLVFVFTVTQLTRVLEARPSGRGLLQVALMLGAIWWMYGGYAWLTNAVAADRPSRRLLLLGGMASYLVLALAIPHAFSGSGTAFALSYLAVVLTHVALFTRSSSAGVVQAILRIAPFNVATALLVLAAGVIGGTAEYWLLGAAVTIEWISPRLVSDSGFEIGAEHFVERHGLVVLIAIGESVVAVGAGAGGHPSTSSWSPSSSPASPSRRASGGRTSAGTTRVPSAPCAPHRAERRPRLAIDAFGYCHYLILLGIVAVAAAVHEATAHAFHELETARALSLAGGVALYLVGDALFRRTLGIGRSVWRFACAGAALATVPLGTAIAAEAQLAAVVALLAVCFAVERLGGRAMV